MKKIQTFMLNHPYISIAFILPFTLILVVGIFSILLNLVLPLIIALWLAGWVYNLYCRPTCEKLLSATIMVCALLIFKTLM